MTGPARNDGASPPGEPAQALPAFTLSDRRSLAARRRRERASDRRRGVAAAVRRLFGPGTIEADGVRYRARHLTPIEHALGPKGKGEKLYDVRFPSGPSMRIRLSRDRLYHDLLPDPRTVLFGHSGLTPGQSACVLGSGTGAGGAVLAELVGPSGSVVCLDRDAESVRFANLRYRTAWMNSHTGGLTDLASELDDSFDAVLAETAELGTDLAIGLRELCRVTRPGGAVHLFDLGVVVSVVSGQFSGTTLKRRHHAPATAARSNATSIAQPEAADSPEATSILDRIIELSDGPLREHGTLERAIPIEGGQLAAVVFKAL